MCNLHIVYVNLYIYIYIYNNIHVLCVDIIWFINYLTSKEVFNMVGKRLFNLVSFLLFFSWLFIKEAHRIL